MEANGNWFKFVAQELTRVRTVGNIYETKLLGFFTRVAAIPLILLLAIMNKKAKGSEEMLCFGDMTRSRKRV